MNFDHPVLSSLLPVVLLIGVGFVAGRARLVRPESVRDISNLVFIVLTQAMLFRTMSQVRIEQLDFAPVVQYLGVTVVLFLALVWVYGRRANATVLALAGVFGNTLMLSVPLVGLAYGQAGQVVLLTLVSVHALVLLTLATLILELQTARYQHADLGQSNRLWHTVAQALRSALLHPVTLPILLGLLYAQTGWGLHPVVDKPLQLLGDAFAPMALMLVGISLTQTRLGPNLRKAFGLSLVKTVLHPLLMLTVAWTLGLRGLPLSVMVVVAALPMGANSFLFAQRYRHEEDTVTAAVGLSNVMAIVGISLALAWLPR